MKPTRRLNLLSAACDTILFGAPLTPAQKQVADDVNNWHADRLAREQPFKSSPWTGSEKPDHIQAIDSKWYQEHRAASKTPAMLQPEADLASTTESGVGNWAKKNVDGLTAGLGGVVGAVQGYTSARKRGDSVGGSVANAAGSGATGALATYGAGKVIQKLAPKFLSARKRVNRLSALITETMEFARGDRAIQALSGEVVGEPLRAALLKATAKGDGKAFVRSLKKQGVPPDIIRRHPIQKTRDGLAEDLRMRRKAGR